MSRIIAISNQKGGVGKTTTAISLSGALLDYSKKVLLIDMDPQGNCSRGVGVDASLLKHTLFDVFVSSMDVKKVIKKTAFKGLDILPCTVNLAIAEGKMSYSSPLTKLKEVISEVEDNYDYIIIDTPPSYGFLSMSSLIAANEVLIPVQCEYFALEGVAQILATISNIQTNHNKSLNILGFLMTMYDARLKLATDITMEIRGLFKEKTFVTQIPRNNSIIEAQVEGIPITLFRPSSISAQAYLSLAREIMDREK